MKHKSTQKTTIPENRIGDYHEWTKYVHKECQDNKLSDHEKVKQLLKNNFK